MLRKLIKYEFRATARTYGGLYLALVALAVLSGFSRAALPRTTLHLFCCSPTWS